MTPAGWAYAAFVFILGCVFAGIVVYYYDRRRKDRVEAPKYRMLDDEPQRKAEGDGRWRR